MSDEQTPASEASPSTAPSEGTPPASDAAPTPPAPPSAATDAAPTPPSPAPDAPAKTDDQLLAERLAGQGASPVMPWGVGPRPADWVDPPAPVASPAPHAELHLLRAPDGTKKVEVDGKWVDLTDDQDEHLRALSGTVDPADALKVAGVSVPA